MRAQSVSELPTAIMPSPARGSMTIPPGTLPTTPTTPIPAADVEKRVPKKEKKRSGVLVGMFLMLVMGGGGAGGYWYFFMGAEWPPDFSRLGFGSNTAGQDSTPAIVIVDDSAAADSQATDTVSLPLPTVGWVALQDRHAQAAVQVGGNAVAGDIIQVSPGSLRVVATRPGYRDFDVTVTVGRGDTVPVAIAMVLIPQPQCTNPGAARYNMNNNCFTTAPAQTAVCSVEVPGDDRPPPAQLWVNVAADGSVANLRWRGDRPANGRFQAGITRQIRTATFTPAQKNGRAVESWMRVTCRAR